ncbi:hypothetical protein RB597_008130 [Gaeumannomyces tritici]
MYILQTVLLGLAGVALAQHEGMDSMDHMDSATGAADTLLVAPGTPSVPSTTGPTVLVGTDTAVVPIAATSSADHDIHATMSHGVSNHSSTSHSAPVPTTTGAPLPAGASAMSATSVSFVHIADSVSLHHVSRRYFTNMISQAGVIALVFALGFAAQY